MSAQPTAALGWLLPKGHGELSPASARGETVSLHEFTSIFGDSPVGEGWRGSSRGCALARRGDSRSSTATAAGQPCMAREPQSRAGRHRSGERVWSWLGAGGLAMAAAWRGQQGSHCPRLGALATEVIPDAGMCAAMPEAAHTYWGTP